MSTPRTFSFCEHVTASSNTAWHIREVGPEGLKLTGGAKTSLCHAHEPRYWLNGWDLDVPLTAHHLGHACLRCVELYTEIASREEVVSAVLPKRRNG